MDRKNRHLTFQNNTKDNEVSCGRGHVHPCCCLRCGKRATNPSAPHGHIHPCCCQHVQKIHKAPARRFFINESAQLRSRGSRRDNLTKDCLTRRPQSTPRLRLPSLLLSNLNVSPFMPSPAGGLGIGHGTKKKHNTTTRRAVHCAIVQQTAGELKLAITRWYTSLLQILKKQRRLGGAAPITARKRWAALLAPSPLQRMVGVGGIGIHELLESTTDLAVACVNSHHF